MELLQRLIDKLLRENQVTLADLATSKKSLTVSIFSTQVFCQIIFIFFTPSFYNILLFEIYMVKLHFNKHFKMFAVMNTEVISFVDIF